MKTTGKIRTKQNRRQAGAPASTLDRPVGWRILLVSAACLGTAAYFGVQWFMSDFSNTLLSHLVKVGKENYIPPTEGEDADPEFFASYKEGDGAAGPKKKKRLAPKLNPDTPPGPAPEGMVWIRGGKFWMGTNHRHPLLRDASPSHLVYVDGFWMDKHEVTNEEFAKFVKATGHVTTAEKPPPKVEGANPDDPKLLTDPWSFVFKQPREKVTDWRDQWQWWKPVFGANWKHPEGPGSNLKGREKHPVVHVSWDDAVAYCKWAKKRLPTEAEWEFAARGRLDRKPFVWGDEQDPGGKPAANYWQGEFPNVNRKTDGYEATAPVGAFGPNGYGLHDMAGNVWEWCHDWYRTDYYLRSPDRNPRGPTMSLDPDEPTTPMRVMRGGSFMCSDNYCQKFIPPARHKGEQSAAWNHAGFRCVRDAK